MRIKLKWIGFIALSCGILVGCEESNGSEKLSDEYVESAFTDLTKEHSAKLPENVKNETVSEDIYKEAIRYITEFTTHEQTMFDFQDKINNNSSLKDDDAFIAKYKESIDSYEVFVKGFHTSPSTEADFELDRNLSDALLYTSYMVSGLRQYVNTGETHHVSSLEENMNKRNTSYTALTNTIKKYELDAKE